MQILQKLVCLIVSTVIAQIGSEAIVQADDWPMWRFDSSRSAASDNDLPDSFELMWSRRFSARSQVWDDPLNLDLMSYDRQFEPIVVEGRLIVGFNDRNKVVAMDASTGETQWTAYTEGPVRFPAAAWKDRVFFCSDDGYLYAVDLKTGDLLWKFRGAPSGQLALGNKRLTSAWPARGGPVVREDTVYFAASIWPFMGTFIYALDATSGKVKWVNDSTGAQYIKQPHSAPSFAGVAPQGALVATKDLLIVPGGRSVPATFDRSTGKFRYFEINAGGKGTGGAFVCANEKYFFVHTRQKGTRAFNLGNGTKTAFMPSEPVLHDSMVYSAEVDGDKPVVRAYRNDQSLAWELEADGTKDLILARGNLVAAGEDSISIIELPQDGQPAKIAHSIAVDATVARLLVANQTLFAVSLEGEILAFGKRLSDNVTARPTKKVAFQPEGKAANEVKQLLAEGDAQGYAIWYGNADSDAVKTLAALSPFVQLAVVDSDLGRVRRARQWLDAVSMGDRVSVHHSSAGDFLPPQYVANMVFVDRSSGTNDVFLDKADISRIYSAVRPYGGVMQWVGDDDPEKRAADLRQLNLEQAVVTVRGNRVVVVREGALPGAGQWTHQYGDIANTIKSDDKRVKMPLGVLWFGGSSNMDVLPRHGHGPPEQVVGGRLFIQGMNCLSARDVYTGRVLWKRDFDDLGTFDVYYDNTYTNEPLNPKYNQVHIPGANGRGTNFVVTDDRVYIVEGSVCHVLDPATGKTLSDIRLPKSDSGDEVSWGYLGVYKDLLIGGLGFARYGQRHGLTFEADKKLKKNRAGFGSKSFDRAASMSLVGFDRYTGKVHWEFDSQHSFWHNGIIAGGDQIYCLDRNPANIEQAMLRRGIPRPDTYRIVALDYRTGEKNWEIKDNIFGTWLSYSEEYDLLVQAGSKATDRLDFETPEGIAVYSASDGNLRWKKDTLKYTGPCILHNDLIITNTNSNSESSGAFYLLSGDQKMVRNPITGEMRPWKISRAYGCNNVIASENLLTFRSGAAGFYDLQSDSGTGNLGGFKSGCTSNLVVADGVLNAPDYTRTCSCAYQNQTSLALVHMPDVDLWSVHTASSLEAEGQRITGAGLNFGAPGDRRDAEGRLWMEYPATAGPSPPISVRFNAEAEFYQDHSSRKAGSDLPWVYASGVEGVTDVRIKLDLYRETDLSKGVVIGHESDDAEEAEDGTVNLVSSDLELVEDSSLQTVGIRFNSILLEQGSKIQSAYVQFTCDEPAIKPTSLIIVGEDRGNARRFAADDHDLSSRTTTQSEVGWNPPPWIIPGASAFAQRTPNVGPIIQEIVARSDWKPGNSIVLLFSGSGKRVAEAYQKGKGKAAKLVVDATEVKRDSRDQASDRYRLQLYSALPADDKEIRVFDVVVQGKRVLEDATLDPSGERTEWMEVIEDVAVGDEIHLQLVPKQGKPVLCGVTLERQEDP